MNQAKRLDLQMDYWNVVGPAKPFAATAFQWFGCKVQPQIAPMTRNNSVGSV